MCIYILCVYTSHMEIYPEGIHLPPPPRAFRRQLHMSAPAWGGVGWDESLIYSHIGYRILDIYSLSLFIYMYIYICLL